MYKNFKKTLELIELSKNLPISKIMKEYADINIIPRATVDIDFAIFTGEDTKQIELSLKKFLKT